MNTLWQYHLLRLQSIFVCIITKSFALYKNPRLNRSFIGEPESERLSHLSKVRGQKIEEDATVLKCKLDLHATDFLRL